MKPAVVFPFHDPDGIYFAHLQAILPLLKQTFSTAILSIPPGTAKRGSSNVRWLRGDNFFQLFMLPDEMPVGKHFFSLYEFAARVCEPDQVLHLCYIDRLAFALQSHHQVQFIRDVEAVTGGHTPLIFQRSPKAWETHPRNYAEVERFATTIGERLFGQSLDFAWCHLAVEGAWFKHQLPHFRDPYTDDMSMVAELVILGRDGILTRDVDWLEWEDPFFSTEEVGELKRKREASAVETQKRLAYVIPMIQRIISSASDV